MIAHFYANKQIVKLSARVRTRRSCAPTFSIIMCVSSRPRACVRARSTCVHRIVGVSVCAARLVLAHTTCVTRVRRAPGKFRAHEHSHSILRPSFSGTHSRHAHVRAYTVLFSVCFVGRITHRTHNTRIYIWQRTRTHTSFLSALQSRDERVVMWWFFSRVVAVCSRVRARFNLK